MIILRENLTYQLHEMLRKMYELFDIIENERTNLHNLKFNEINKNGKVFFNLAGMNNCGTH